MKKNGKIAAERLKNVLLQDKIAHPERLSNLLENDVYTLLSNYFDVYGGSVRVSLITCDDGLNVKMEARARRVKPLGTFGE